MFLYFRMPWYYALLMAMASGFGTFAVAAGLELRCDALRWKMRFAMRSFWVSLLVAPFITAVSVACLKVAFQR